MYTYSGVSRLKPTRGRNGSNSRFKNNGKYR